ncbi:MAG: hypothetical protein C0497_05900 [Gemmatimonas sp.]|nr:hypothetical protein [Gemmatimonas sp.]
MRWRDLFWLPFPREYAANPMQHFGTLASQVPIAEILDDVYALTDGSLAVVFRVTPFDAGLADEGDYTRWHHTMSRVLNAMTPGLNVKVIHRAHHNYQDRIDAMRVGADGENAFGRVLLDEDLAAWQGMMHHKLVVRADCLITLTFRPKGSLFRSGRIVEDLRAAFLERRSSQFIQRTQQAHRMALEELDLAITPVRQAIEAAGLKPKRLTTRELEVLAYELLNPETSLREPAPAIQRPTSRDPFFGRFAAGPGKSALDLNPSLELLVPHSTREQLCHGDLRVTDAFVEMDGARAAVVSMRLLPTHTHPAQMLPLLSLGFASQITVDAYMLDKAGELKRRERRKKMLAGTSQVTFFKTAKPDEIKTGIAAEAAEAYTKLADPQQQAFRVRVLVTVWASSSEELTERVQLVLGAMRSMQNMHGLRERFAVDTLLKQTWPFMTVADVNCRKTETSHLAALLPLYAQWEGARSPTVLFRTRASRVFGYDPFDGELMNKNVLVTGTTGSGKSFNMINVGMLPALARQTEIMVVESGASYEAAVRAAEGHFLRVGPRAEFQFNLLDLPGGFLDLPEGEQQAVIAFKCAAVADVLQVMAGIQDVRENRRLAGILAELTKGLYDVLLTRARRGEVALRSNVMPRLGDVVRALRGYTNDQDPDATRLAQIVATDVRRYVHSETPAAGGGVQMTAGLYAKVFDAPTTVPEGAPLLVLDFADIKDVQDLMGPLTIIWISGYIYNRVMRRDGVKRLVQIDEGWSMIKHPLASQAVVRFYREIRKYGGSVWLATQGLDELDNERGRELTNNAGTTVFLRQATTEANKSALRGRSLTRRQEEAIFGLQQRKGEFSEFVLDLAGDQALVRLEPTPLRLWLATTDPKDIAVRTEYVRLFVEHYGLSWAETLVILAHDYPAGVQRDEERPRPKLSEYAALALAERFRQRVAMMELRIQDEQVQRQSRRSEVA